MPVLAQSCRTMVCVAGNEGGRAWISEGHASVVEAMPLANDIAGEVDLGPQDTA